MINKPTQRLLRVSVVVLIASFTTILMKPVYAQLEKQNSVNLFSTSTSSEPTRIQESNGTVVILPASYSKENSYPALILLPFTGGTAADLFDGDFAEQYQSRTTNPFIVILPAGQGSANDYNRPGAFGTTIERYERLVRSALSALTPKYNIDASRVAIGGYSLGGDLSWALSLRNPGLFQGTIVIGSLSSYRNASNMPRLAANNSRFFMIMGEQDERLREMRSAVSELARYNVIHRFETVPGADHYNIFRQYAPREMLTQSVDYVLFNE